MAFSLETSGFNISPVSDRSQGTLAQIQPIAGAGSSIQIKPLAGWQAVSSKPELVAEGITNAVSAIGKGIEVAYKQSQEDKKEKYKAKQDWQKYVLDLRKEQEKERHDDAMILQNRAKTLPFSGQFAPTDSNNTPEQNAAETEQTAEPEKAPMKPVTEGATVQYVPNQQMLDQLTQMTQQPLSTIAPFVSASSSTGPAGTPYLPISQPQYTGVIPGQQMQRPVRASNPEWRPFQNTPEGYQAAVREAARHYEGYQDNPEVVEDPHSGGWKVARKHSDEIKAGRYNQAQQRTLDLEASRFNSDNAVKNFTSMNGMQQSFPKFMKDYEEMTRNPKAAGISQIGLLDMYARAEAGGRVTEAQSQLAQQAASVADKFRILFGRPLGGNILGKDQVDQMMAVVAGDHQAQTRIANQKVTMMRRRLQKSGINDEEDLPQYFIEPKLRSWHNRELDRLQNEAAAIFKQKQAAKAAGRDTTSYDDKLKLNADAAEKLQQELDSNLGEVLNMHEIETTPQGWMGSSAAPSTLVTPR